nr:TPA_asm: NADH dehydrogenase subunit 2 [Tetraponera rufonigra]
MILFKNVCLTPLMVFMALTSISLTNIMMIWFVMEINNFMFIALMMISMKEKKMIFLYFIVQIISSTLMIISLTFNPLLVGMMSQLLMFISLLIKTGIPPFHLWMPMMASSLSWMTIFFLCTIQKIIPLAIFNLFIMSKIMIVTVIIMTLIVPSVTMINLKNFKKLILYSSINQSGWMIILIFLSHPFWMMYMLMYSMIMLMMCILLNMTKLSNLYFQYSLKKFNATFTLMMMNIASMPPFSFFLFKWTTTFLIIMNSNMNFIMISMLINSLIMTYIYINMMSWSLFTNQFKSKMKLSSTKLKLIESSMIIIILLIPLMILL